MDFKEFTGAMLCTRIAIYGTCLTVAAAYVITVGNANAQEAVLAIKVLMSFNSAEKHHSSLLSFLTYLQCTLAQC